MSAPRPRSPSTTAGDPVGLLDAQLLRAAHDRLALGERAQQRHQRSARRSPAAPRPARPRCPRAAPRPRRARRPARRRLSVPGSSRSPRITAPIRSAMRKKPVRVQFRPTSSTTTREPGTSVAAATMKAADEGSPGTVDLVQLELVDLRDASSAARRARTGTRARRSMRSVWSRLGRALDRPSWSPSASIPAISTHDLTCALGHRQLVVDPGQLGAAHGERREAARRAPRRRRPSRAAARRSGPPGGGGSTRRRRASRRRPGCPASQPGSSRSSVPELPTSSRPPVASSGACRPTPRIRIAAGPVLLDRRRRA